MSMRIVPVISKSELREFIHLPSRIHRNHPNWVPPIYTDEWEYFNPKKNKAFSYSDTILILAIDHGKVVGRVMGIINHLYNGEHNEKTARFCHLETYEDSSIVDALLGFIEGWAAEKGMERIVGPLGFSEKDPQGLLVEGFNQPNVVATVCNYPYLVDYVVRKGYGKEVDLVVYKVPVPNQIPELYRRILERVQKKTNGLRMVEFNCRSEVKPFVRPVFKLVNETFRDIYGFNPFEECEMDNFANRYLPILQPRFIKVIVNERREVVAFVIGMPDISVGIRRSKGYLFPFGIFHILYAQHRTKQLNLLLGSIHEHYRNMGLDSWMGAKMFEECKKAGIKVIDSHLELETNFKVRAEMEKMGGVVYKRFRIFGKSL